MKITDLSLREKVLQTSVIRVERGQFCSEKVGGIYIGGSVIDDDPTATVQVAADTSAKHKEYADIPPLICSDFENGCGCVVPGLSELPYIMGLGASNDCSLAHDYGKITAMDAKSVGVNWSLSPVCDLSINPRNLSNVRCISDNPDYAVKMLGKMIKGMQENGVAACLKHFPGGGLDWRDSHMLTTSNTLGVKEWWEISGKVFLEMIKEDAYSVMIGHDNFPAYQKELFKGGYKLPASLSKEIITNLLKGEMDFKGVTVTDALDMGGCLGYYESKEKTEIESFKAGSDIMLWPSKNYVNNMIEAVENGYVPIERLDDAVSRILDMKEKLGLFKENSHYTELTPKEKEEINTIQQKISDKSLTLVKDEAGFFPLKKDDNKKIAVVTIAQHESFGDLGDLLSDELKKRGLDITHYGLNERLEKEDADRYDIIICALFGKPHRPIGFLDYFGYQATKIMYHNVFAQNKYLIVSFASPYFATQYYERALTYVNAYTSAPEVVKSFVKAATGEIEFGTFSPVKL